MNLTESIKQKALDLGFDLLGVTTAETIDTEQVEFLQKWLKAGFSGRMEYMKRNFEKRIEPAKLLNNAKTVICVGLNYTPSVTKSPKSATPTARVSNYAQYEDYHPFIKKQLRKLTDFISSQIKRDFRFKICVDSAPVAERALAARAGLGFIGKNHMLINPELGCQIFLGEIITDLELSFDKPVEQDCSDCGRCVEACPTGALRPDGQFDASRCISYLTIEHKGQIPTDLARVIGDRIFGCDQCVLACRYQQKVTACGNKEFKFYPDRKNLELSTILNMSEAEFEAKFADCVIKRTGLEQLKRNTEICLENINRSVENQGARNTSDSQEGNSQPL